MSGLSGLDTEGLVMSLMQIEQARIDKVTKAKDLLVMKQEEYREVITALQGFVNSFFNTVNSSKDMRNASSYSVYSLTYADSNITSYFKAVAGTNANTGNYTIKKVEVAKVAKVSGDNVSAAIVGEVLTQDNIEAISSSENNNKISVEFNGTIKEIVLDDNPADINALREDLQNKLNAAFGSGKITVKVDSGALAFETDSTNSLSFAAVQGNTGLKSIGLEGRNTSNKINIYANISDIANNFAKPLSLTGEGEDISFEINGKVFSFNSATTSLSEIMTVVNSNTEANVTMKYDSLNNKFTLESKTTGAASVITANDISGGLLSALSINASGVAGTDAVIVYDDGENGEQTITRSTNNFTINGITFELLKNYEGSAEFSIVSDPSGAVEMIKGFVEKYNEVLDIINNKLYAERDYSYEPLTEAEKEALSDEEIEKWEKKVKTGLLANDSLLRSLAFEMRSAITDFVESAGLSLGAIGISSSDWTDRGKLYVNEEKLRKALTENADKVIQLFTSQSDVIYTTAATDPEAKKERRAENGIIYRLYDVLQDYARTSTIENRKGALLEKAGITGDRSAYNNTLTNQIREYEIKIGRMYEDYYDMEDRYYAQFAVLERLINDMNTQSAWLGRMFA